MPEAGVSIVLHSLGLRLASVDLSRCPPQPQWSSAMSLRGDRCSTLPSPAVSRRRQGRSDPEHMISEVKVDCDLLSWRGVPHVNRHRDVKCLTRPQSENVTSYVGMPILWLLLILVCSNPRSFARAFRPNRVAELLLNRGPSRTFLDLARIDPSYFRDDDGAPPIEEEQRKDRRHQHGSPGDSHLSESDRRPAPK